MYYLYLAGAVLFECWGTALMKLSAGFSQIKPSIGCLAAYAVCFWCLSKALQGIPLAVAYASWGAAGIVLATAVSAFVFHEAVDLTTVLGIALCVAGTLVVNASSAA